MFINNSLFVDTVHFKKWIILTANFVGKIAGSTVENPHGFYTTSSSVLASPTVGIERGEYVIPGNGIGTLDGKSVGTSQSTQGNMSMHRFSFNLIEEVERKIGKIPGTTVADKVAWMKSNVLKLTVNWHGFGSSVGGNKSSFSVWRLGAWFNASGYPLKHTDSTVTKLTGALIGEIVNTIQPDGFIHFLAYAEPSDGATASTINTDYIELEIHMK